MTVFVFYAVAFDPIEIQTYYAPQNGRLNLRFLKDFGVVGKKWPGRVIKWPFLSCKFSGFFFTKLQKKGNDLFCISCCSL